MSPRGICGFHVGHSITGQVIMVFIKAANPGNVTFSSTGGGIEALCISRFIGGEAACRAAAVVTPMELRMVRAG